MRAPVVARGPRGLPKLSVGCDGRWSTAHVESALDEPFGYRVPHPRNLADAGGDAHAGKGPSCRGFRRRSSVRRDGASPARLRASMRGRRLVVAGPLQCADEPALALGEYSTERLDSDCGRGGPHADRGIELRRQRLPGNGRSSRSAVKDFAFEPTAGQRAVTSLPPGCGNANGVLARVAHVLRWAPEARTFHSTW